ncbi:hypothetical protein Q5424_04820 [Conexibacter sp. JD483]|uniref:hypothetical protein n=1 Tax=unclassified Conexibacter TaxID=2627773 RepID=UPI002727D536|nr:MULTISPECIES: hypothetical protein [unclassified Conexibacter]MDO8184655.1 hypothetical protein [Conexibacter sp. CPCC 205706]MDO8197961.1 hypothetical protein [Conexibacter sp. CPCC 205762]MDR9368391.1 hypothetical protein [Conexibacter sp. JD483]
MRDPLAHPLSRRRPARARRRWARDGVSEVEYASTPRYRAWRAGLRPESSVVTGHLKRAVRERMAATGEKYTQAYRALTEPDDGFIPEVVPGKVTAVMSSGGHLNLDLIAPALTAALATGQRLIVVPYEGRTVYSLPGLLDLAVMRGITDDDAIAEIFATRDRARLARIFEAVDDIEFWMPRVPQTRWEEKLDNQTVVWVQDVQAAAPLGGVEGDPFRDHGMRAQLTTLRRIARDTGAGVAIANCTDIQKDWKLVAECVDTAYGVEVLDRLTYQSGGEPRDLRIHCYDRGHRSWQARRTAPARSVTTWRPVLYT